MKNGDLEMKMIYNHTNKHDLMLPNGQQLLSNLGHLRAKLGPGTLRPSSPNDATIRNVCRRSSEAKNCKQPQ
jgi:hypothetical protein